jgi:predicted GTPase
MAFWAVAAFLGLFAGALWRPVLPPLQLRSAVRGAPPAERLARERVAAIIAKVTPDDLRDGDTIRDLVVRVFDEVAQAYHPGRDAALLQVTLPELLRAAEVTLANVRRDLLDIFPSAQDMPIRAVDTAAELKAWSDVGVPLYRVGRFVARVVANPWAAIASELGSVAVGLSQRKLAEVAKCRAAEIIVRQAGETAILLYSGRCRREAEFSTSGPVRAGAPQVLRNPSPARLRVAVLGQVNAGKSSLVNALLGRSASLAGHNVHTRRKHDFEVEVEGVGPVNFVDHPGFRHGASPDVDLIVGADMVLWAIALHRADRAPDAAVAEALRQWSARQPGRRVPPIIVVPTHMDRLDPSGEWEPPYDWERGDRTKERSAAAAVAAVREALAWPEARLAPVMLREGLPIWNLDAVRAAMTSARREAELTQMSRIDAGRTWWDTTVDAAHSGRGVIRTLGREVRRLVFAKPR